MAGVTWDTRLDGVVGAKAARPLADELGIRTAGDLLEHYPRRYVDVEEVSSLAELVEGDLVTLVAQVGRSEIHPYRDKRTGRTAYRVEVEGRLGDGQIWMTFFERNKGSAEWRAHKQLEHGRLVVLSGGFKRNTFRSNRWELTHPEVTDASDDPARLLPVYPLSGKLRSDQVRRTVR